jgi:SnoaL-like domain
MQNNMEIQANGAVIQELLDLMKNDSENLERTLKLLADDCVWVMEPGGTEYHGIAQIKTMAGIAMNLRGHDEEDHRVEILNCFSNGLNFCIEYSHGMVSTEPVTGAITSGLKGGIRTGVLRYCMVYTIREGKIDQVHEYINSSSWWLSFLLPIGMAYLHRTTTKRLAKYGTQ